MSRAGGVAVLRAMAVVAALWAGPLWAQTPTIVASGAGGFAGAAGLSPQAEADADQIAALEQQAFREFRWDVVEPAELRLVFEASVPEAAQARLMISSDGEAFQPLPEGQPVAPGQVVSLIVAQPLLAAEGADADSQAVRFLASDWVYEISAQPLQPPQSDTIGPILLPIVFGDGLGCNVPGCGEGAETASTAQPDVTGAPQSTPPEAAAAAREGGRELARELQTELARVGCYTIGVDGLWGPGSRRAMQAFNAARGTDLPEQTASARALVVVAQETGTVCGQ